MTIIIETPKGSNQKFRFDDRKKEFTVNKTLPAGLAFPFDFGFVPQTRGDDGDPLDVLVIAEWTHSIGASLNCRIIGCLPAEQTQGGKTIRNDRFIAVPQDSVEYATIDSISQISPEMIANIESFFISYLSAEEKKVVFLPRLDHQQATQLLQLAKSHLG